LLKDLDLLARRESEGMKVFGSFGRANDFLDGEFLPERGDH
jgi:hypothetical protein